MPKNSARLNHGEHFSFSDSIVLLCGGHLSGEERDGMPLARFFDQLGQDP
jgi:hypothetical protein